MKTMQIFIYCKLLFCCNLLIAQTNISWMYKATKSTPMTGGSGAVYNNSIYVLGGSNTHLSNYLFDPVTNTWNAKAALPGNGSDEGGAYAIGNNIYLVHGTFDENIRIYNISSDSWNVGSVRPIGKYGRGPVVAAVNNYVYAIGGGDGNLEPSGQLDRYDPSSDSWTTINNPMPTPRAFAATVVFNNIIYTFGGLTTLGRSKKVEAYNPTTNSWSTKASMPTARSNIVAALLNGKIYVIGGYDGTGVTNIIEEFDPNTNMWNSNINVSPSFINVASAISGVVNNKIYVLTGNDGTMDLGTTEELTVSSVASSGSVNVNINPSAAITGGAQWNIDGGNWQNSGVTLNNISIGSHTIYFNSISGWSTPASKSINITNGNTTYVTGNYVEIVPGVIVTSPNGGENWMSGSNQNITAGISGNINRLQIDYSLDGGSNWIFISGMSTTNTTLNYSWKVPNNISTICKIRITIFYSGGSISDASDANFTISSSSGEQTFSLNQSLSHLRWPFPNSTWKTRNGWRGGEGGNLRPLDGGPGSGHGEGGHHLGEYFADDWNNLNAGSCYQDMNAPISGTVIFVNTYCQPSCGSSPTCGPITHNCDLPTNTNPSGYGNQVVIQSNIDPKYAFRVCHLNEVHVSKNQVVNVGDKIGEIGNTGGAYGAHAHCVLYKNIDKSFTYFPPATTAIGSLSCGYSLLLQSTKQEYDPNNFAVDFIFDAVKGGELGSGGGSDDTIVIAIKGSTVICPGDSTLLTAPQGSSYYWSTGSTTQSIYVSQAGQYYVSFIDTNGLAVSGGPINILVNPTPSASITVHDSIIICKGDKTILSANEGYSYLWSTLETTRDIVATDSSGIYKVTVTDYAQCGTSSAQINLTINPLPAQPIIQVGGNILASSTANNCNYQWFLNGVPILGATNQFDTAHLTGFYTVQVTDKTTGCSSTSNPQYIVITGIESIANQTNLIIYPNPTTDAVYIEFDTEKEHRMIIFSLYNSLGVEIYRNHIINRPSGKVIESINLSNLSNGIYQLKIKFEEGLEVNRKVVIQK